MSVRVRFAPSPTGSLHIGGVRTALFCWLYARQHKGQFLLRIEDTDLERSEQRFTDDILASMKWLGLNWDEEIIYQSKRLDIYAAKAEELIQKGHAYRCYCSEEDVEKMREVAMAAGKRPMYDRRCRAKLGKPSEQPKDQKHVIRAAVPLEGSIAFTDLIRGEIRVSADDMDDYVLIRSNGAPTYNLSVVVDDVHSRMTHIIRGDDHINNTPKQMFLYQCFGYPAPKFAHLPMILGADKKKLSKRHGAVSLSAYRAEGYLPEAMLNFLARIGWSHGDQELFTIDEMVQYFSFDHVQVASGVFNTEKLVWVNAEHIKKAKPERLTAICVEDFSSFFTETSLSRMKSPLAARITTLVQPKLKLVKELAEQMVSLCTPGAVEVDASGLKWVKDENLKVASKAAVAHIANELGKKMQAAKPVTRIGADAEWGSSPALSDIGLTHTEMDAFFRQMSEQHGVKLGDLMQPIRLVVTGRIVSGFGLFELLTVLPWDVVEPRLRKVETL